MISNIRITTTSRNEMVDITTTIVEKIKEAALEEGLCTVYSPHTTAAVTINEGHDPDVVTDILSYLKKLVPADSGFRHYEGNSDSHIKVALLGPEVTIPVSGGKPVLGTWQRIFFCEFDGPRKRNYYIALK